MFHFHSTVFVYKCNYINDICNLNCYYFCISNVRKIRCPKIAAIRITKKFHSTAGM